MGLATGRSQRLDQRVTKVGTRRGHPRRVFFRATLNVVCVEEGLELRSAYSPDRGSHPRRSGETHRRRQRLRDIRRDPHFCFDSSGFLIRIRYMSCTMRPSTRTLPPCAKESSTGVLRICAITVSGSTERGRRHRLEIMPQRGTDAGLIAHRHRASGSGSPAPWTTVLRI